MISTQFLLVVVLGALLPWRRCLLVEGSYYQPPVPYGVRTASAGYEPYQHSYSSYGSYHGGSASAPSSRSHYYDVEQQVKDYQNAKYYYGGKFKGSCSNDGLYYKDETTFVICSNGYHSDMPCPPGTKTSGYPSYQPGYYYGYTDLCSVNLVDYGYGPSSYMAESEGYEDPLPYKDKLQYNYHQTAGHDSYHAVSHGNYASHGAGYPSKPTHTSAGAYHTVASHGSAAGGYHHAATSVNYHTDSHHAHHTHDAYSASASSGSAYPSPAVHAPYHPPMKQTYPVGAAADYGAKQPAYVSKESYTKKDDYSAPTGYESSAVKYESAYSSPGGYAKADSYSAAGEEYSKSADSTADGSSYSAVSSED